MTIRDILQYRAALASDTIARLKSNSRKSVMQYMNPQDPEWPAYLAQKREASLYFSCLNILNGREPGHGQGRHARRLVAKLRRQLGRRPERFELARQWSLGKEARAHAADSQAR